MSQTQTLPGEQPALNTLKTSPIVVAGKWHELEKPVQYAAFRLSYIMIGERYAPQAVYQTLCVVFRDTGLLSDETCQRVVNVSAGFAGMPVQGIG